MAITTDTTKRWIRTAGGTYFDFFTNSDYTSPVYEATVYKTQDVKSVGIAPKVVEKIISGSGRVRDHLILKMGFDISVEMNQISPTVANKAEGVTAADGYVVHKTTTEGTEFAFGVVFSLRGGYYVYMWFPRCRLIPPEVNAETETDSDIPDPGLTYTIKALPLDNDVTCVAYYTESASGTPVTEAAFFAAPKVSDSVVADQTDFTNILPVAALPTEDIDATAVYVLTDDDGLKLTGTMWRYLSETWTKYEVA